MPAPRTITFCYRKLIDATATRPWEKMVFEDTYAEFRLQAQTFSQGTLHRSFAELLQHVPGAGQLHFLVRNRVAPETADPGGVGLVNLRRRLALLYPGRHTLAITANAEEYAARLSLQIAGG